MNAPCSVPAHRCRYQGPGVARHHVLGRGADGEYIQPELLLALCQPECHQAGVHRVLQAAGLDGPKPATPGVLISRIACNLAWLGWDRRGCVTLPAELLAGLAEVLGPIGRELRQAEVGG
jgi:hypothetical protein